MPEQPQPDAGFGQPIERGIEKIAPLRSGVFDPCQRAIRHVEDTGKE
jgi:hypothetical protein